MATPIIDFIQVDVPQIKDEVLNALRAIENKYQKMNKPFDRYGAMNDFEDYCDNYNREYERAVSRKTSPPVFKKDWDWNKYGDKNRFTLVGEVEPEPFGNSKTNVPQGTVLTYVAHYVAISGAKIAVSIPKEKWEEQNKKK